MLLKNYKNQFKLCEPLRCIPLRPLRLNFTAETQRKEIAEQTSLKLNQHLPFFYAVSFFGLHILDGAIARRL